METQPNKQKLTAIKNSNKIATKVIKAKTGGQRK
jgi:hypothetical protein